MHNWFEGILVGFSGPDSVSCVVLTNFCCHQVGNEEPAIDKQDILFLSWGRKQSPSQMNFSNFSRKILYQTRSFHKMIIWGSLLLRLVYKKRPWDFKGGVSNFDRLAVGWQTDRWMKIEPYLVWYANKIFWFLSELINVIINTLFNEQQGKMWKGCLSPLKIQQD